MRSATSFANRNCSLWNKKWTLWSECGFPLLNLNGELLITLVFAWEWIDCVDCAASTAYFCSHNFMISLWENCSMRNLWQITEASWNETNFLKPNIKDTPIWATVERNIRKTFLLVQSNLGNMNTLEMEQVKGEWRLSICISARRVLTFNKPISWAFWRFLAFKVKFIRWHHEYTIICNFIFLTSKE